MHVGPGVKEKETEKWKKMKRKIRNCYHYVAKQFFSVYIFLHYKVNKKRIIFLEKKPKKNIINEEKYSTKQLIINIKINLHWITRESKKFKFERKMKEKILQNTKIIFQTIEKKSWSLLLLLLHVGKYSYSFVKRFFSRFFSAIRWLLCIIINWFAFPWSWLEQECKCTSE